METCQKEESRIRIPSAISSSQLFPHFPFKSRQVMHPPQESENFWRSFRAAGMAFSLPSGAGFERMSPSDTAMALATPQISPVATPAPRAAPMLADMSMSTPVASVNTISTVCAQLYPEPRSSIAFFMRSSAFMMTIGYIF